LLHRDTPYEEEGTEKDLRLVVLSTFAALSVNSAKNLKPLRYKDSKDSSVALLSQNDTFSVASAFGVFA
jgi:hypothetical protein